VHHVFCLQASLSLLQERLLHKSHQQVILPLFFLYFIRLLFPIGFLLIVSGPELYLIPNFIALLFPPKIMLRGVQPQAFSCSAKHFFFRFTYNIDCKAKNIFAEREKA